MAKKQPEAAKPLFVAPSLETKDILALVGSVQEALKGELVVIKDVSQFISTGIPQLDIIMGGGVPVGRLTTFQGAESTGKSSIGYRVLAEAQRMGGAAAVQDVERSAWYKRCVLMGLDMDHLIASQPDTLDTYSYKRPDGVEVTKLGVFDTIERLLWVIREKAPQVLFANLVDSIAGSSVAREMEREVGKGTMGNHSLVTSQGLRKLMAYVSDYNLALIFINQIKKKVGVMFGDDDTTIAEKPIGYHSSIIVKLARAGFYPKDTKDQAIVTRAYVSKNKVAPPFRTCTFRVFFDRGIDTLFEDIECLEQYGELGGETGWVTFGGKKMRKQELYFRAKNDVDLYAQIHETTGKLVKEVIDGTRPFERKSKKEEVAAAA